MIYRSFKFLLISSLFFTSSSFALIKALNTAATGMQAQDSNVNTISNNIANVNTVGYKRQRTEFEDLKYQTIQEAGAKSSANSRYNVGIQIGSGAKVSAIRREFTQGSSKLTSNPFDLLINGKGFFGIQHPDQIMTYTRDGAFEVDNLGTLVTKQGYKVFPGFTFPPNTTSVNISREGAVEAFVSNQVEPVNLGTMPVYTFTNPAGLSAMGGNLYRSTQSSGEAANNKAGSQSAGVIVQGSLETSNVSIMTEMTDLIKAQRAYEMNSKVMKVADEMLQVVNGLR